MKKPDAQKIIKNVAMEYLGEHWNNKLTSIQRDIWEKRLIKGNFETAKIATRQMFIDKPAYKFKEIFKYSMPDVDIFINYYNHEIGSHIPYCPCCAGTGRIYYPGDRVSQCTHEQPDWEYHCQNLRCEPRPGAPCPLGNQYYNSIKIDHMNKLKESPDFKLGLTFLNKRRDFVENLVDQVDNIPGCDKDMIPL